MPVASGLNRAALLPDGSELYVANTRENTVAVIRLADRLLAQKIKLSHIPEFLAAAPNGRTIYATGDDAVSAIDTNTKQVRTARIGKVNGLGVSADSRSVYLASYAGVLRLEAANLTVTTLHAATVAWQLAVAPTGERFYVNYRNGGPGGRSGHDAIAEFASSSGQLTRTCLNLANVGDSLAVSPDGTRLWIGGLDACSSRRYDHTGCPMVPAGIINIIDTRAFQRIDSISLIGSYNVELAFSPDGQWAVTAGKQLIIFDTQTLQPVWRYQEYATTARFSPDGRELYVVLTVKGQVAIFSVVKQHTAR